MNYRYSYSGSDAAAFVWYPGLDEKILRLDSLHTVSMSVHEAKGQVRTVGFRGIRGLTRSVRTIAGSMIFIVTEDHPLRQMMLLAPQSPLYRRLGWSQDRDQVGTGSALSKFDFGNRLGTLLPPLNFMLTYVHEVPNTAIVRSGQAVLNQASANGESLESLSIPGAALLLEGVEFVDEGLVTSTNDMVSEITYSFIARDYKQLSLMDRTFNATVAAYPTDMDNEQNRKQKALQARLQMQTFNAANQRNDHGPATNQEANNRQAKATVVDESGQPVDINSLTPSQVDALRHWGVVPPEITSSQAANNALKEI